MSTPDQVIDTPAAPVTMPPMPAHQVALLVRGLQRYQATQQQLYTLRVSSPEGFAERHEPAQAAEAHLRAALDAWAREYGVTIPPVPGAIDATRPVSPPVELGTLTLTQLWRLRLATDWVLIDELDAERALGTPAPGLTVLVRLPRMDAPRLARSCR